MAQNYDFAYAGWTPPAYGGELVFGTDANGNLAAMPPSGLRSPQVVNWDPQYLRRITAALSKVRSGKGNAYINCVGHSAVQGVGAGLASSYGGNYTKGAQSFSMGALLSKTLNSKGISSRNSSWWGTAGFTNSNTAAALSEYDPRLAFGSGMSILAAGTGAQVEANKTLCGQLLLTSTTTPMNFTPVETWDTATAFEATTASSAASTFAVGGTTLVTNTAPSALGLRKTSMTTTAAVQTLSMYAQSTAGMFPIAMEMSLSTTPQVLVRNMGQGGAQSSDFADTVEPYSALNFLTALGGDLTIIELIRNDQYHSVPVATWQANIQAIITAAQATGDVILVHDHQPLAAGYTTNDAQFTAALYQLAETNGCPVFDIPARIGTPAQANALGYFEPDQIHYLAFGWQNIAGWIAGQLATL